MRVMSVETMRAEGWTPPACDPALMGPFSDLDTAESFCALVQAFSPGYIIAAAEGGRMGNVWLVSKPGQMCDCGYALTDCCCDLLPTDEERMAAVAEYERSLEEGQ